MLPLFVALFISLDDWPKTWSPKMFQHWALFIMTRLPQNLLLFYSDVDTASPRVFPSHVSNATRQSLLTNGNQLPTAAPAQSSRSLTRATCRLHRLPRDFLAQCHQHVQSSLVAATVGFRTAVGSCDPLRKRALPGFRSLLSGSNFYIPLCNLMTMWSCLKFASVIAVTCDVRTDRGSCDLFLEVEDAEGFHGGSGAPETLVGARSPSRGCCEESDSDDARQQGPRFRFHPVAL